MPLESPNNFSIYGKLLNLQPDIVPFASQRYSTGPLEQSIIRTVIYAQIKYHWNFSHTKQALQLQLTLKVPQEFTNYFYPLSWTKTTFILRDCPFTKKYATLLRSNIKVSRFSIKTLPRKEYNLQSSPALQFSYHAFTDNSSFKYQKQHYTNIGDFLAMIS